MRRALSRVTLAVAVGVGLAGCPGPDPAVATRSGVRPRVATAAPALAEMVCAIGGREHLVGVSRYCTHPAELATLPRVGGAVDPNLEAIEALAPDLILMQGKSEVLEELAARRPFELVPFTVETIDDVLAALKRLGELLGRTEGAAREVARLEQALAQARARGREPRPRVLAVFGHRPGELGQVTSFGRGTFVSQCLEAVGGTTCLETGPTIGYPLLSLEAVAEARPEWIVELLPDRVTPEGAAALRADWALLADVPAVAAGRIAIVTGNEVLLPGPRLDRVLAKLTRALDGELLVQDDPAGDR